MKYVARLCPYFVTAHSRMPFFVVLGCFSCGEIRDIDIIADMSVHENVIRATGGFND